jgi:pyrimidine deaminase RibD-like protein
MADKSYTERDFMEMAIEEARKSKGGEYDPKVGAVFARGDQLIDKAFRGKQEMGCTQRRQL